MFEMVLFIGLIVRRRQATHLTAQVPMPFKWRRAMFRRISESPIVRSVH